MHLKTLKLTLKSTHHVEEDAEVLKAVYDKYDTIKLGEKKYTFDLNLLIISREQPRQEYIHLFLMPLRSLRAMR